jgi:hypothetical protein
MDNKLIKIIIFTLLIDIIYLYFIGGYPFLIMVNNIQNTNKQTEIKYIGAILAYIFIVFIIYYFIIKEDKKPKDAFLLGLCVYGIFDATNYALFEKYSLNIAIQDTLWGGTLFYLVTYLSLNIKLFDIL